MIERLIEKHLRGFRGSRILDLGPGYAEFSRCAARTIGASSILFADNDPAVLAYQLEKSRETGIEARVVSMLITPEAIGRLEGRFDLIHCQEVLEHLRDAEAVLAALAGRLSPGGRIIITVPTARSERIIRFVHPGYMRDEPFGHVREFDEQGLRRLLDGAGLAPDIFIPAQPHYFIGHLWLFGTQTPLKGSTGQVSRPGFRQKIFGLIVRVSRTIFAATGQAFWSRLFPRNFFIVARRGIDADSR